MRNNYLMPLKIVLGLMWIVMVFLAIKTALESNLWSVWPQIKAEPWFAATLVDFYFNITLISLWVLYKEKCKLTAWAWIIGFIGLGSVATILYVLIQLCSLREQEPLGHIFLRHEP